MQPNRLAVLALVACVGVQEARCDELRVLFGNLHSHTSYSDGQGKPKDAYRHARDVAHLDFLAVTEHNHRSAQSKIALDHSLYAGSGPTSLKSAATQFTKDGTFIALYGQEFSSIGSGNHANVFEIGDVIDEELVPNGRWDKLLREFLPGRPDSQGLPALLLLNHPAQSDSPNELEYGRDDFATTDQWRQALGAHAALINIVNGPSHDGTEPGRPSESEYLRYLSLGFRLGPTADQDNHRRNWGSAANTRTGVVVTTFTKPALLEALRARHVYATEDRNLRLIAHVNGKLMGSQLTALPSPGSVLQVTLDIADDDEPFASYAIQAFRGTPGGAPADEAAVFTVEGNGQHSLPGVTYDGGNQYVFLKVTQGHDDDPVEQRDRAWLAPIWLDGTAIATPPVAAAPVVELDVDLSAERAIIRNAGAAAIDLLNWTLISTRGDQRFFFADSLVLEPGESVTVTSGTGASHQPPATLKWQDTPVWNNEGDPAELRDAGGVLVASD